MASSSDNPDKIAQVIFLITLVGTVVYAAVVGVFVLGAQPEAPQVPQTEQAK